MRCRRVRRVDLEQRASAFQHPDRRPRIDRHWRGCTKRAPVQGPEFTSRHFRPTPRWRVGGGCRRSDCKSHCKTQATAIAGSSTTCSFQEPFSAPHDDAGSYQEAQCSTRRQGPSPALRASSPKGRGPPIEISPIVAFSPWGEGGRRPDEGACGTAGRTLCFLVLVRIY